MDCGWGGAGNAWLRSAERGGSGVVWWLWCGVQVLQVLRWSVVCTDGHGSSVLPYMEIGRNVSIVGISGEEVDWWMGDCHEWTDGI